MEQEVKYRLAKWLVADMLRNGIISRIDAESLMLRIRKLYDPPLLCLETEIVPVGDDVILANRDDRLASEFYRRRLICETCGSFYGPRPEHSNEPYRKIVWRCARRWRDDIRCESNVRIPDKELRLALHQCARELLIHHKVDKTILRKSKDLFDPEEQQAINAWFKEWRAKNIKWCISDESDLLMILETIFVKADERLEFLFRDSSNVEYRLMGGVTNDKQSKRKSSLYAAGRAFIY